MANKNQDWDDLGRSIQDIVDKAVNSHDYQKLNQTVCQAVGKAVQIWESEAVRKAMEERPPRASTGQDPSTGRSRPRLWRKRKTFPPFTPETWRRDRRGTG